MQYSKIHIESVTKKYSVENLKIRIADATRPAKIRQNRDSNRPDPTRPEPTRGSIRPVDNSNEPQLIRHKRIYFLVGLLSFFDWCYHANETHFVTCHCDIIYIHTLYFSRIVSISETCTYKRPV